MNRPLLSPRAEALAAQLIPPPAGLKIWNGSLYTYHLPLKHPWRKTLAHNESVSAYGCAKSRAELERMFAAFQGGELLPGTSSRIRNYWNQGAWGNSMSGITPEPGIWLQRGFRDAPVRVWPPEKANG